MEAASIGSFAVPFAIDSLRLSPGGRLAAFVRAETHEGRAPSARPAFQIRHGDGSLAVLDASDLAFIDDRRVLRLMLNEAGAELAVASFDGAPVMGWREHVPEIRSAAIAYDGARHRWILARVADRLVARRAAGDPSGHADRTSAAESA